MKAEQNCRRLVQQTAQKIYGVQRNMNDFWMKAVLLWFPNDKPLLPWCWKTFYSCKATIGDFSAYSTRYQQNEYFRSVRFPPNSFTDDPST